jgi:hypothetical protein
MHSFLQTYSRLWFHYLRLSSRFHGLFSRYWRMPRYPTRSKYSFNLTSLKSLFDCFPVVIGRRLKMPLGRFSADMSDKKTVLLMSRVSCLMAAALDPEKTKLGVCVRQYSWMALALGEVKGRRLAYYINLNRSCRYTLPTILRNNRLSGGHYRERK